ncbi:MAG: Spy/CpxP family protein refolding chaperone [Fimbriimonadales bacterium]
MKKLVVSLVVVAAMAAMAMAQGGGGGGRGGAGGGQGRMGFGGGGGLLNTVQRADVQKELAITDAQKTKIEDLATKAREDRRAMMEEMRNSGGQPDMEAMRAANEKMAAKQKKDLEGILNADQLKRLGEIDIQLQGGRALMNPEVQKKLNLTDDQKKKLTDIQADQREKMQQAMEDLRSGGGQPDRTEMQKVMEKLNAENSAAMLAVLTAEQKAQFEAMKGKPFKADPNIRRGGGGGGGNA